MTDADSEAEIHAIIERRASAVRTADIEQLMIDVAPDIEMFDVVEPLHRTGAFACRERAEQWLDAYEGAPDWENGPITVAAGGDVAFSHGLSHVTGRLKSGQEVDMWFRTTLGFQRFGGRWLIVHDHGSVPFDPVSGKASLGLHP